VGVAVGDERQRGAVEDRRRLGRIADGIQHVREAAGVDDPVDGLRVLVEQDQPDHAAVVDDRRPHRRVEARGQP
jgi:hypothetical protein